MIYCPWSRRCKTANKLSGAEQVGALPGTGRSGPRPAWLAAQKPSDAGMTLAPVWALSHIIHRHATLVPDVLAFSGLQLFFQSPGMNARPRATSNRSGGDNLGMIGKLRNPCDGFRPLLLSQPPRSYRNHQQLICGPRDARRRRRRGSHRTPAVRAGWSVPYAVRS